MEEALVQSAMAEIAMWNTFNTGRVANATGFLAIVLAVWVAARFSSVSLEKNVNLLGKVFVTAFAVGVFLSGLVVYGNISGAYEAQASALAALDAANGDIDLGPGSQACVAAMAEGGNMIGKVGGMLMLVAALGIAVIPLWVNTND
jgi:hypothetical protein